MKQILTVLLLLATWLLAACGEYVPPTPTRSAAEARQTERALLGLPTMAPVPTIEAGALPVVAPSPTLSADRAALLEVPIDDPRALGSPSAPVTIIEYSDFECPFCGQFFRETRPQIEEQYVKTGIVRMVYRDYPLPSHRSALLAAVASRCAANQGKFWEMYNQLFSTHQEEWGGVPNRDRDVLIEFATNLGLDTAAFEVCLDDEQVAQAVQQEAANAEQLGINSTPNFFVNGQLIRGALPFATFQRLIEAARTQ